MPDATPVPEFTQIYTLPCAERQAAVDDGHRYGMPDPDGFDMGRHVIRSFGGVLQKRQVFRYQMVEYTFKVAQNGWVRPFIQCQPGGGMPDEHMQQSRSLQGRQRGMDLPGDQVESARQRANGQMDGPEQKALLSCKETAPGLMRKLYFCRKERPVMDQAQPSTIKDWILFLISAVVCVSLLVVAPEWFWVPLPFVLTFLVRAMRAM